MDQVYQKRMTIMAPDTDCFGRLKPSGILSIMQEAAEAQCLELALDWQSLAKHRLFWALTRQTVCINRLPTSGETITVETWPGITTRVAYPRSTLAYDAQGNELFRALGLWVLMDLDTRTMVVPGKSGISIQGILRGQELPVPSSIPAAVLACETSRPVRYTELDRNGHVNNARYLDWLEDLLPGAFHQEHPMEAFTVCYLNEIREGENVSLHWQLDGSDLRLEGIRAEAGQRAFAIRAKYRA